MISPKRKNRTVFYRRLKGMTQAEAAEFLHTCKSNIANMESEKHFPSEAYRKLLNIAPRELTAPLMPTDKQLLSRNFHYLNIGGASYENPSRDEIYNAILDFKNMKTALEVKGEFNDTCVYAWKANVNLPSLSIEKGEVLPVIPRILYQDGAIILYRPSLNKLSVAKLSENGSSLLAVAENEENPDICLVEVIGEIITK